MTLEDFFTLTEMKDGLTAPARVKELVNVMLKEKDCSLKNVGDATRQWSTVASTIAATEEKDCLDLFVKLDGLLFIDRWLKDAQKFGNDSSDSFVEESITALLCALEKLHIDYEKSMLCGIGMTVKNLLGHNSSRIQDRARALFHSWKQDCGGEAVTQDVEKVGASPTDEMKGSVDLVQEGEDTECSAIDIALSVEGANEEKQGESPRAEMTPSTCSDISLSEKVDDVEKQTFDQENLLDREVLTDENPLGPVSSSVNSVRGNLSIKEESPVHHSEGTALIETCTYLVPKQGIEGKSDMPDSNEYAGKTNQVQKVTSPPIKLGTVEICSASSLMEPRSLLGDNSANAEVSVLEPDLRNSIDTKDKTPRADSPIGDTMDLSVGKSGMDDTGSPHCFRSKVVSGSQGNDSHTNVSVDSYDNEGKLQKLEGTEIFLSTEDSGPGDRVMERVIDGSEDLRNDSKFFRPATQTNDPDVVDKRRSDLELDYSMADAPIKVDREVVDPREQNCSYSEKKLEGGNGQPGSSESKKGKEFQLIETASNEAPTGPNLPTEASPQGEELLNSGKNLDAGAEHCRQDMESSQVTEAALETEVNEEKGLGGFDLNQEVLSEDMDHPINQISTPISVVSASRVAAVPGLPAAPLQFEGAHGWKGSAATSAFRPASPRRVLEGDKTITPWGRHNSSKQRQDFIGFDLNVAEFGDDKFADLVPGKQILESSSRPSGESSAEASSRRSERLNFDLNRVSDDGNALPDWRLEGRIFPHRNGHRSPSPSSSSSSVQPALRNIDLNDQPSFYNDSSDVQPYIGKSSTQNLNAFGGGLKSDDSVISIMGTRVEVNRKDFVPQTRSLQNGRIVDPMLDINLVANGGVLGLGSALSYGHHPIFGYNGLTSGSTVTFPPPIHGPASPIPYMVDSRGAPIVPQIVGSASASPAAYSVPPFFIGTSAGLNGAGHSRANFDLNSGLMIEGGVGESGGLRQFLNMGPSRSSDEHLFRANSQPSSSSGIVGKRKEPDGGWEPYPFNYKHHQPPWE